MFVLAFFLSFTRTCPKNDPRFKPLIQRVTQNFDTFEDYGSIFDNTEGKKGYSNHSQIFMAWF